MTKIDKTNSFSYSHGLLDHVLKFELYGHADSARASSWGSRFEADDVIFFEQEMFFFRVTDKEPAVGPGRVITNSVISHNEPAVGPGTTVRYERGFIVLERVKSGHWVQITGPSTIHLYPPSPSRYFDPLQPTLSL